MIQFVNLVLQKNTTLQKIVDSKLCFLDCESVNNDDVSLDGTDNNVDVDPCQALPLFINNNIMGANLDQDMNSNKENRVTNQNKAAGNFNKIKYLK